VRQNVTNVDTAKRIVNFSDQSVLVSFDVENCPPPDGVGARKCSSNVRETPPRCLLSDAKPRVERNFEVSVPGGGFFELLAADDVHADYIEFA
jgi:hypothetical protein